VIKSTLRALKSNKRGVAMEQKEKQCSIIEYEYSSKGMIGLTRNKERKECL